MGNAFVSRVRGKSMAARRSKMSWIAKKAGGSALITKAIGSMQSLLIVIIAARIATNAAI